MDPITLSLILGSLFFTVPFLTSKAVDGGGNNVVINEYVCDEICKKNAYAQDILWLKLVLIYFGVFIVLFLLGNLQYKLYLHFNRFKDKYYLYTFKKNIYSGNYHSNSGEIITKTSYLDYKSMKDFDNEGECEEYQRRKDETIYQDTD